MKTAAEIELIAHRTCSGSKFNTVTRQWVHTFDHRARDDFANLLCSSYEDEIERLHAQVATLTETIEAARTAMSAAPAWHEMHRVAIDQLKMAKYVTETDYMEEPA